MATVPFRRPPSTEGSERSERPPLGFNDPPQTTILQSAPPPDVYSMMAAVQMHREGRLVKPGMSFVEGAEHWPLSKNIEDRRNQPNNPDNSAYTDAAIDRRNWNYDKTPGDDPGTLESFAQHSGRMKHK